MTGEVPLSSDPLIVIGEGLVINDYPVILPNPIDDPEEFCPICEAWHYSCFTLPGIGGPPSGNQS